MLNEPQLSDYIDIVDHLDSHVDSLHQDNDSLISVFILRFSQRNLVIECVFKGSVFFDDNIKSDKIVPRDVKSDGDVAIPESYNLYDNPRRSF